MSDVDQPEFVLTGAHKAHLEELADEHLAAPQKGKKGIVTKATDELIKQFGLKQEKRTIKEEIRSWFYERNDRKPKVIAASKFGFVKPMTAQRLWVGDNKSAIDKEVKKMVPSSKDSKWIGEYSKMCSTMYKAAGTTVHEEYDKRIAEFNEGIASRDVKASYGDYCYADFCRAMVSYSWKAFGAELVLVSSRPTLLTPDGSNSIVVFDKDVENPHRLSFTEVVGTKTNWHINDFSDWSGGKIKDSDGIIRKDLVIFHRSGEPMLPETNSLTPLKVKRKIATEFMRIHSGLTSSHVPYKEIIEGVLENYIEPQYYPDEVQGEPFMFNKPHDMRIEHFHKFFNLIQDNQEKFLRREVDCIFRLKAAKVKPTIVKAVYEEKFMKEYALEHGTFYQPPLPSLPTTSGTSEEPTGRRRNEDNQPVGREPGEMQNEQDPGEEHPPTGEDGVDEDDEQDVIQYLQADGVANNGKGKEREIVPDMTNDERRLEAALARLAGSSRPAELGSPIDAKSPAWAGNDWERRQMFLKGLVANSWYQAIVEFLCHTQFEATRIVTGHTWASWDSRNIHLPREYHLGAGEVASFVTYVTDFGDNAATLLRSPKAVEEFVLTVGLAWRDMDAIAFSHDVEDDDAPLPGYMTPQSHLNTDLLARISGVVKAVCDIIPTLEDDAPEDTVAPTALSPRDTRIGQKTGATKESAQMVPDTTEHASPSVRTAENRGGGRSKKSTKQPPKKTARREKDVPPRDIPAASKPSVPRPQPRKKVLSKRAREDSDGDEDLMFIRQRLDLSQPEPTIRRSARAPVPKKRDNDFVETHLAVGRRGR
ncbi:hypothetical protein QCA50_020937 [Cerrena zonata]|uniref:Uncharacterized protein n=1 Tax=Cerrena zonata TaxID=2478898 RepID=A0AAW0FB71_9APHY